MILEQWTGRQPQPAQTTLFCKVIALTPSTLSLYFQDLYNSVLSTPIYKTNIYKFDANSSKKFQTAILNQ